MPVTRKLRQRTTPAPAGLVAVGDIEAVDLSWSYPDPPSDFTRFDIYRDGVLLDDTTVTSYRDTTAADGVEYDYTVFAVRTNPHSSREYVSTVSNTASASWSSGESADIEILSTTHDAAGPTISINTVTGASLYQFERSIDPLIGFAEIAEQAGTSYPDASGTAGTAYFYRARYDGTTASAARIGVKRATAGGDAVTLGTLELTANITDAFIKLPVTGDANNSATAFAEYRIGSGAWHHCPAPLWRAGAAFYGALPLLTPNTEYTVRVTVADTGGVSGTNFADGTVTTKSGTVSDPAGLTPDQTVSTLAAAITAGNAVSSDQVIRVSAGYVQRSATALIGAGGYNVTLVAENLATTTPAGGFNAPRNNATAHTVVYERFTAPTSSDLAGDDVNTGIGIYGKGGWTAEVGLGSGIYSRNVGAAGILQIHYTDATAASGDYDDYKAAEPLRVGMWKRDSTGLSTAAGWANLVLTNLSYNAGGWQAASSTTLYLRLPGGLNPNNCYVWMGSGADTTGTAGVNLNGPNLRVSGFNFRALPLAVRLSRSASNFVIDRNHTRGCFSGVRTLQASGGATAHDGIIQYNRFTDSNMWNRTPDDGSIAWRWLKQNFRTSADVDYTGTNRVGADSCESKSVIMDRAGRLIVTRWCDTDGIFNGMNAYLGNADETMCYGMSIYECTWRNIGDDCVEPEGRIGNWVVTRPDIEDARVGFSTDFAGGPLYIIGAKVYHVSTIGVIADGRLNPTDTNSTTGGGSFFKTGGDPSPRARLIILNSTMWNDEQHPNGGASRAFNDAVSGVASESYYIRNSIMRNVSDIGNTNGGTISFDEDYNAFATETGEWELPGGGSYTTIAAWRAGTTNGDNTNKVGAGGTDVDFLNTTAIDALFTDAEDGDLTLAAASPAENRGRPLGSINESDSAPDLGYEGTS